MKKNIKQTFQKVQLKYLKMQENTFKNCIWNFKSNKKLLRKRMTHMKIKLQMQGNQSMNWKTTKEKYRVNKKFQKRILELESMKIKKQQKFIKIKFQDWIFI